MASKVITVSFYLLFSLTALVWAPVNFELFEYNKMIFVYILTIIITASWIIKMLKTKKLLIKKTPLDIPVLLFLGANILSTVFSIDPHTSLWGYYSRSNGGLFSTISYILLYYALVSNFEAKNVLKFLKAALFGGAVVALWAIPEHFGVSPSCILLTGQFNASCWIQDVAARVFATLGQPNWLAAYLAMLIFPTLYFLLTATKRISLIAYSLSLFALYLAFTFTYSRGATLGLVAGIIVLLLALSYKLLRQGRALSQPLDWQKVVAIVAIFAVTNLAFGSALSRFNLTKYLPKPQATTASSQPAKPVVTTTQLETGGTDAGKIRLIVWKGALEIFEHYPILGSGVETFAYSYYNFRPKEHNLVSEWEFLYNKAHNEYLNYLATTGIIGFLSYMAIIVTFMVWGVKYYISSIKGKGRQKRDTYYILLIPSLLASYVSYLVQNFFSFSLVVIALFFFFFPAITFLATETTQPLQLTNKKAFGHSFWLTISRLIYRRPFYPKLLRLPTLIVSGVLIFTISRFWVADTYFFIGSRANDSGNAGRAYNALITAVKLNPGEPYYHSELGYAAANAAADLATDDSTTSATLKNQAVAETQEALRISPANVSYLRTAVRTYYILSTVDKSFADKTLQALDQAMKLAPTDPKLPYNKAIILGQEGKDQEAEKLLRETIALKSDYRNAHYSLGLILYDEGKKDDALKEMNIVLKLIPNDPEALGKLKQWEEKS